MSSANPFFPQIFNEEAPFKPQPPGRIVTTAAHRFSGLQKPAQMNEALWVLLQRCWSENPIDRPSMAEIVECLAIH
jgi:hypothetical protein